jgi:AraC-like DNA-binding protein
MKDTITRAAERAVTAMHDKLGEPITVDDMARVAMFSKFHFTRMFQDATGVSPGRFLSALRLQRAKHLLTTTSLTVVDISILVGYNSVGTFSSRFSRSVGLSPSDYRRLGGHAHRIVASETRGPSGDAATVRGVIEAHHDRHGPVFTGLFSERVPEGRPVRCTIMDGPGPYRFDNVPPGRWFLLAQATDSDGGFDGDLEEGRDGDRGRRDSHAGQDVEVVENGGLSVGTHGPIVVRRGAGDLTADVCLKPAGVLDPPVLLALTDARRDAVDRVGVGSEPGR